MDLADNIIDIYKKHGRAWTTLRGEFLYEQTWLDRFLALLPQHSNILDLGCGSGKPIAQYLIESGHNITGVDASDSMLEMAKQNFPAQAFPHLQWILSTCGAVLPAIPYFCPGRTLSFQAWVEWMRECPR